jgi:hypothetical protein
MSLWAKIRGTIETIFQLGLNGPNLKNNGGNVDVRNAGDTAYVNARGADPVIPDDLTTKRYVDALTIPGSRNVIRIPIALATVSSVANIPPTAQVLSCRVEITTAYNLGATISVGQTGAPTSFQGTGDNNPQQTVPVGQTNIFEVDQDTTPTVAPNPMLVTITGATAGAGFAIVEYAIPLV